MNAVDFTPQWYRAELQAARHRRRRLGFVGLICVVMICWFAINEGRIQQAQAMLHQSQATSDQSQLLSAKLASLKEDKLRLHEQLQHYERLARTVPPSVILAEISHRIPADASVVDFKLEPLTEPDPRRGKRGHRERVDSRPTARAAGRTGSAGARRNCQQVVTLTAHARNSNEMFRLVRDLSDSPLFAELSQSGITNKETLGTTVKQKTIRLYVLSAECIGP